MNYRDYFQYASFANLAYVEWDHSSIQDVDRIVRAARDEQRAPPSLVEHLFDPAAQGWSIPTSGFYQEDDYGFAANLFTRGSGASKETVLAVRGTDAVVDILEADLYGIGFIGVALNQAVSMFNWIRRLTAPPGTTSVTQYRVEVSHEPPPADREAVAVRAQDGATLAYIWLEWDAAAEGLALIAPGEKITVVGHSLGGHLAALAQRVFPDLFTQTVTFNAPGFDSNSADVALDITAKMAQIVSLHPVAKRFGAVLDFIGNIGDIDQTRQATDEVVELFRKADATAAASSLGAVSSKIHWLESEDSAPEDDASIVSSFLTGTTTAGEIHVPTELNSHSMDQFMDNLAVLALIEELNEALTKTQIDRVFLAASPRPEDSSETLVERLHKVFFGASPDLELSEVAVGAGSWELEILGYDDSLETFARRAAIHDARFAILGKLGELPAVKLIPIDLADSAEELAELAEGSIAYRYALRELSPFAITGDDSLYEPHNAFGDLDADSASSYYLKDRAAMLLHVLMKDVTDTSEGDTVRGDAAHYTDIALGIEVDATPGARYSSSDLGGPSIVFGTVSDDRGFTALPSTDGTDRLYGGRGNDVVSGGAGADVLDGGVGNDTLYGGLGNADDGATDTLVGGPGNDVYFAGDGDVVIDTSGADVVHVLVEDAPVAVGGTYRKVAPNVFRNDALNAALYLTARAPEAPGDPVIEDARLVVFGAEGAVAVTLEALVVGAQPNGRYGITLENYAGAVQAVTASGQTPVVAGSASGSGAGLYWWARDGIGRANRDDRIEGTNLSDELYGINFDWDPNASEKSGGRDYFYGRGGNDLIASGGALDPWRSTAYAGDYGFGKNASGQDIVPDDEGDFIDAGAGDDIVLGADGNDDLLGGEGEGRDFLNGRHGVDFLEGGEGDDVLLGGRGGDVLLGGGGADVLLGSRDVLVVPVVGGFDAQSSAFSWRVVTETNAAGRVVAVSFPEATYDLSNDALEDVDKLWGGAGNDFLYGQGGNDRLYGEGDDDVVIGGRGDDFLDGGSGSDYLLGDAGIYADTDFGNDTLHGGSGDDTLFGEGGNDTLYGDGDHDTLSGGEGADSLYGGAGNDQLSGHTEDDVLDGGAGEDTLWGGAGNDTLSGGSGRDQLSGDGGDDLLFGGAEDDTLVGGAGNDTLAGGTGNDTLAGGGDNDAYHYAAGDGIDFVVDSGGQDVLVFGGGIRAADVTAYEAGSNLVFEVDATNKVVVTDWKSAKPIDRVRFTADGTSVDHAHFLSLGSAAGVALTVTESSAEPIGTAGDDHIAVAISGGSPGTVSAGAGNDAYFLTSGANAVITDTEGSNTLVFGNDVPLGSVTLALSGGTDYLLSTAAYSVIVAPEAMSSYVFADYVLTQSEFDQYFANAAPLAPTVRVPLVDVAAFTGEAFHYQIPAGAFYDPNPGDSLSYSVSAPNGELPGWLEFNAKTGVLSGTPWTGTSGAFSVVVTATDEGSLSVSDTFVIDIARGLDGSATAMFEYTSIDGVNGFWVDRVANTAGFPPTPELAAVGDLNADGIDDFFIRQEADFDHPELAYSRVVFGTAKGFGETLANVPRNGVNGFELDADAASFVLGDVNADGIDDLVIDTKVLLGQVGPFEASVDVASLPEASSYGEPVPDRDHAPGTLPVLLGTRLSEVPVGDMNGDGVGDFVIRRTEHGKNYASVVYGLADVAGRVVDLDALTAADGFSINVFAYPGVPSGVIGNPYSYAAWGEIAAIGDVNNDGLDDIAISSDPYLYASQSIFKAILFGRAGEVANSTDLLTLDGTDGLLAVLPSPGTGYSIDNAARGLGDINGDGVDDVAIIGRQPNASYVIYGRPNFTNVVELGTPGDDVIPVTIAPDAQYRGTGGNDTYSFGAYLSTSASTAPSFGSTGGGGNVLSPVLASSSKRQDLSPVTLARACSCARP